MSMYPDIYLRIQKRKKTKEFDKSMFEIHHFVSYATNGFVPTSYRLGCARPVVVDLNADTPGGEKTFVQYKTIPFKNNITLQKNTRVVISFFKKRHIDKVRILKKKKHKT